jgi:hypothetical protein
MEWINGALAFFAGLCGKLRFQYADKDRQIVFEAAIGGHKSSAAGPLGQS